tara:strand:- start:1403 stop:1897 length:495 start_codon:yes stop_codon:yes gene_type:complete
MKCILLLITWALFSFNEVRAQEQREVSSFAVTDEVKIDNAPKYYSNFFSEYHINEHWNFRIEMQEITINDFSNFNSVFDFPFLVKHKMTNKFSVLFGPKIRVFKGNGEMENVSLLSTFGIQYDITKSFSIEGRVDFNLTPNNSETINYNLDNTMIYKLGGRLKF